MQAGAARFDITPAGSVWMDGMIRDHKSEGIHDPLYAHALYLADGGRRAAIVSTDVCGIGRADALAIRQSIERETGIPKEHVILAATHTHSGPALVGFFNPHERDLLQKMSREVVEVVKSAVDSSRPALSGCASGVERTVSHYRRFFSPDGRPVMIWEENPKTTELRALGESDPEVGVLVVVDASDPARTICVLFNHAGHPNAMSGDNYLISADYPGVARRIVEENTGGLAIFTNGAQGSVDIDNWSFRDWEGMQILGARLAQAVLDAAGTVVASEESLILAQSSYTIPARKFTQAEIEWAEEVLRTCGGSLQPLADGVGDDYKARLYKTLHESGRDQIEVDQTCIALGECAFISVPGELFTEVGLEIKRRSPFPHTWVIDLANGYIGYIPTREAIAQGGYEVDTRRVGDSAADIILKESLSLLTEARNAQPTGATRA